MRRRGTQPLVRGIGALATAWLAACGTTPPPDEAVAGVVVVDDPYGSVSWSTAWWAKIQLHDHAGVDTLRLRAYDVAGYGALAPMTYSGFDSLPYSWRERRWPEAGWIPGTFRSGLTSVKLWFPNAEEVGFAHILSPFAVAYLRRSLGADEPGYRSTQECVDMVSAAGGFPILAHAWTVPKLPRQLRGLYGMEVYNAFAEYRRIVARDSAFIAVDANAQLVAIWDTLLSLNPRTRGVAVNDHYGPDNRSSGLPSSIRDSGKTLVIADGVDFESLRLAIARGSLFAVRDLGLTKDVFPRLDSLRVQGGAIEVFGPTGPVRWIGAGQVVGTGARLPLGDLAPGLKYVRAEVGTWPGSVLYTQAFGLGPAQ